MTRASRIAALLFVGVGLPSGAAAQEDGELARQAFVRAFGAAPAETGSAVLVRSPQAGAAIAAGRIAVASPADRNLSAVLADRLGTLVGSLPSDNILETLLVILKESLTEMKEDEKYWLEKLAEMNKMSEALSEYLEELAVAGRQLGELERGSTHRTMSARTVPIMVRTFDPAWVEELAEPSDQERAMFCDPCLTTRRATLSAEQIQREQESTLGIQRRLQESLHAAETRRAEAERRSEAVVRMLAEVLRTVDRGVEGRVSRAVRSTS
jgi:hypothetical protein